MSKQEATVKLSNALQIHGPMLFDQTWSLKPGQAVSLGHSKGRTIACIDGRIWVTVEHDTGDLILEANQSVEIAENGRVVISALDSGAFKVA
jgi:hypothetical protein